MSDRDNESDGNAAPAPVLNYEPPTGTRRTVVFPVENGTAHLDLPRVCCWCLGDATEQWHTDETGSLGLPIPICRDCKQLWSRRGRRIWWAVGTLTAVAIAVLLWQGKDQSINAVTVKILTCMLVGFFGGYFVQRYFGHPVVVSLASRHTWRTAPRRIFLRNRRYATLVIRGQRAPDVRAAPMRILRPEDVPRRSG